MRKNFLSLLLLLTLALTMLVACSNETTDEKEIEESTTAEETSASQASESDESSEESSTSESTEDDAEADQNREIIDMAGRSVVVPSHIDTIFSQSPVTAIYLYTLVPEKLLGWNYELNEVERSVILEEYQDLPNFGMGDAINFEAVIAADPTIALIVGTINDATISDADALQDSLGIPVVVVDGDLTAAPEAYRFMGDLFGVEDRAEELAAYAEKTFDDIESMNIPEDEKVRIYYGNGEDSLETAPVGSSHGQLIDMVQGINVADLEMGDGSRVQISAEQLLAWDPDVIVLNGEPKADITGDSAAQKLMDDPNYASLKAVQEGKVYGTPNAPFSWVDRPTGANRIVGVRWLTGLIYPDYVNYNVDEEVKEFFRLFYHTDLTDERLQQIYRGEY